MPLLPIGLAVQAELVEPQAQRVGIHAVEHPELVEPCRFRFQRRNLFIDRNRIRRRWRLFFFFYASRRIIIIIIFIIIII